MTLLDSLLDAIIRLDGEALVMHAGEKPYVVLSSVSMSTFRGPLSWGQVELSSRPLTTDAVLGMLAQMLSPDQSHALEEFGAIEQEIDAPGDSGERFVVTAARGGEDVWVEVRRRPKIVAAPPVAEPQPAAPPEPAPEPMPASVLASEPEPVPAIESEPEIHPAPEPPPAIQIVAEDEDDVHELQPIEEDLIFDIASTPTFTIQTEASRVTDDDEHHAPVFEIETNDGAVFEIDADAAPIFEIQHRTGAAAAQDEAAPVLDPTPDDIPVIEPPPDAVTISEIAEAAGEEPFVFQVPEPVAAAAKPPAASVDVAAAPPAEDAVAEQPATVQAEEGVAEEPATPPPALAEPIAEAPVVAEEPVVVAPRVIPDGKVAEIAEQHVAAIAEQEVTAAAARRVGEIAEQRVTEIARQTVTEVAEQHIGALARQTVGEVAEQHVAAVAEQHVAAAAEQHVAAAAEQQVAAMVAQKIAEIAHQRIAEIVGQTVTDLAQQHVAEIAGTKVTELAERRVAEIAEQLAETAQQKVAEIIERKFAEIAAQHITAPPQPARAPEAEAPEAQEPRSATEPPTVVVPYARPVLKLYEPPAPAGPAASEEASLVELLRAAAAARAADVYAVVGTRPMMRVEGQIAVVGTHASVAAGDVERFIFEFAPRDQVADADPEWTCTVPDVGRVRCITFHDHSGAGLIFHLPAQDESTADALGIPSELQALASEADGLVVVAGPRSSGKSTLLSALVDLINRTRYDHVITIESQIRKVHDKRLSFISQREVRGDGDAIAAAARAALREGPDVLVIEDLRAPEALIAALDAARAGRLVFGSISAPTAPIAVQRLIDAFPADRRPQVRASLSGSLRAVIAQLLVPKAAGGRTAAREVLFSSPAVRKLVLDGAIDQLPIAIESGRGLGMRTMVDSLGALVRDSVVDITVACASAPDRGALITALERDGIDVTGVERRA